MDRQVDTPPPQKSPGYARLESVMRIRILICIIKVGSDGVPYGEIQIRIDFLPQFVGGKIEIGPFSLDP